MDKQVVLPHHDDLDVFDFGDSVWRQRWLVGTITVVFAIAAIVYALTATQRYKGEAVVVEVREDSLGGLAGLANQIGGLGGLASVVGINLPQGDASRNNRAVLQSRLLAETFIRRYVPLEALFRHSHQPHTLWRGVRSFRENVLSIDEDARSGKTTVTIEWTDPATAARWANEYVELANEMIRKRVIDEANRNIQYLNEQVDKTTVLELRRVLYNLIESETKRLMLANGRPEYAFELVDPAVPPEIRAFPKRTIIVVAATFAGLIIGSLIALLRDARARRRRPSDTHI